MIFLALWKAMLFLLGVILFTVLAVITVFVVMLGAAFIVATIIVLFQKIKEMF